MRAKVYRDGVADEVELVEIGPELYLEKSAAADFLAMDAACCQETGCHFVVNSAWRSYEEQKVLNDIYRQRLDAWIKGGQKGNRPLRPSRPGFSKHEPGDAIDIDLLDDNGQPRPYCEWLRLHHEEYHFIHPIGKEPWHHEHVRK